MSELRLVLGMTPELFARIAPALRVYSGRPVFDPNLAPKLALLTLPGVTPAKSDAMVAARGAGLSQATSSGPSGPSHGIDVGTPLAGRAFAIEASVQTRLGETVERRTVVRVTDDPRRRYWVLER